MIPNIWLKSSNNGIPIDQPVYLMEEQRSFEHWKKPPKRLWQIDEILITLPNNFVHLVEKPTDLQLMNEASEEKDPKIHVAMCCVLKEIRKRELNGMLMGFTTNCYGFFLGLIGLN